MMRCVELSPIRRSKSLSLPFVASALTLAALLIEAPTADAARRKPQEAPAKAVAKLEKPDTPLTLVVSIPRQRLTVYGGTEVIADVPVSTGQRGFDTPTGVFTILQKNRTHFSNLYDSAPMPFMQRLTWSGVALHAGQLPGYPASHGCIRLPASFAPQLFGITELGARVVISRDDAMPSPFQHDKLFKPLPTVSADVSAATGTANGDPRLTFVSTELATRRTRESVAAERQAAVTIAEMAVKDAETAKRNALTRAKDAASALRSAAGTARKARVEASKHSRLASRANKGRLAEERRTSGLAREVRPSGDRVANDAEQPANADPSIYGLSLGADAALGRADASEQEVVRADDALRAAETERDQAVESVRQAELDLRTAQDALQSEKRAFARRDQPITVFVSRKLGRMFVRQGHDPIGEFEVTIADRERLLGTHVYTVVKDNADGTGWTALSIPTHAMLKELEIASAKPADGAPPVETAAVPQPVEAIRTNLQTASLALDRLSFSAEAQEFVAEHVKPGTSLIISDYGTSNETGKYTDFIVLTKHPDDPPAARRTRRPQTARRSEGRRYRYRPVQQPLWFW